MAKVGIIGCGAWGVALANLLVENGHEVLVWCHDPQVEQELNSRHTLQAFFDDKELSPNLKATVDLQKAVKGFPFILTVVASHFFRKILQQLKTILTGEQLLISATKGLEEGSLKRMSELAEEELGADILERFTALSGPNLSKEVMNGSPATAVAACRNIAAARKVQELFNNNRFRVYTNTDIVGVELGGTLKNVIALAAGILDGMKLGDNAKAALMVRGAVEMRRLAVTLGAETATIMGLSGMGDMIATCASKLSRNHQVGVKLAEGQKLPDILKKMKAVAEGVNTARAVHELAEKLGVEMPITTEVYNVLYKGKAPQQALLDLMTRDPKAETIG